MTATDPIRLRDRNVTEAKIIASAQDILLEHGPKGFGVNAVAKAAGVDKQLIYRYFGGLDGLLEALGEHIARWWQTRLESEEIETGKTYVDLIEVLALRLLGIMRTEPLARQSALWELTDTTGLARKLTEGRTKSYAKWMAKSRHQLAPPPGVDAPAVNAMIIAGISYLVLSSAASGSAIGMDAKADETWARVQSAIVSLVRGAYEIELPSALI